MMIFFNETKYLQRKSTVFPYSKRELQGLQKLRKYPQTKTLPVIPMVKQEGSLL